MSDGPGSKWQENLAEGKAQWLSELRPFVDGSGRSAYQQDVVRTGSSVCALPLCGHGWRCCAGRHRETLRAEVASTVTNPATVDQSGIFTRY